MKLYKRSILRLFFVIEIFIFIGVYFFGGNGFQYLNRLEHENDQLHGNIVRLKDEIAQVQKDITDWNNNDFYKEKIAREKLQMARRGDQIYFLDVKDD